MPLHWFKIILGLAGLLTFLTLPLVCEGREDALPVSPTTIYSNGDF
jgi:hypothetical protein